MTIGAKRKLWIKVQKYEAVKTAKATLFARRYLGLRTSIETGIDFREMD